MQEHQISMSGAKEDHTYYISANYFDQSGIVETTSFKRYTFRFNSDNKLTKWLKVGNSFSVANSKQIGMDVNRTMGGEIMAAAMFTPPTIAAFNEDGSFAGAPTAFYQPKRTPYSILKNNHVENRRTDLIGNIYGDVSLFKGLSFRTNVSVVMNFTTSENFAPTFNEGIAQSSVTNNSYTYSNYSNWLWNNVFTYNKSIKKHHITALGGMEATESRSEYLLGTASFGENVIRIVKSVGASTSQFEQNFSSNSLISYFGNFSYNYDQKYYLEGNIRRDGSSQFGLNSRWGTFPSVSGAWRLSKESFFPKTAINDMKLRLSYGEVGNNKIGDFSFIAPLKTVLYSMSGNDNQYNTGTVIAYMANPNLKWETSKQTNFGVDISLLDSRLTLAADYFVTNVEDMLLGLQIPAFTGISFSDAEIKTGTVTSNVGSLTNKGFEFEASYKGKIGQVAYSVNGNLTTFHNEVTNIGNNEEIWGQMYKGQNISRTIVGGSLGEFYGYVADGIFQTQSEVDAANALDGDSSTAYQNAKTAPGDYKFKDLDGDNKITADDRTTIGSPIPDFTYGLGINLEYKDFTFSTLLVGSQGNDVFFASRTDLESSSQRNYNKSRVMLDAWNGAGSSNTVARIISSDPNQNSRISSKFVEDGSYLRVRNIQLGYNIPARLTNKIKASKAQVYISGQNLFTFTKYSGFDPEVGNLNGSNLNAGIDTDLYPQAQSIHIGASITF
jgi:TonB-linked SusC/RagA family outer membrane protein